MRKVTAVLYTEETSVHLLFTYMYAHTTLGILICVSVSVSVSVSVLFHICSMMYSTCSRLVILVIVVAWWLPLAEGLQHRVGDSIWSIPTFQGFYTNWSSSRSFQIGDTLVFQFQSDFHNVLQVSRRDYESCIAENQFQSFWVGPAVVPLLQVEVYYFICSIANYCALGQKVSVTVEPVTATPPSLPPLPPSSPSSPSPSPSPSVSPSFMPALPSMPDVETSKIPQSTVVAPSISPTDHPFGIPAAVEASRPLLNPGFSGVCTSGVSAFYYVFIIPMAVLGFLVL